MKLAGETHRNPKCSPGDRLRLFSHVGLERSLYRGIPAPGNEAHDFSLERPPHGEDFPGVLKARLGNGGGTLVRIVSTRPSDWRRVSTVRASVRLIPK